MRQVNRSDFDSIAQAKKLVQEGRVNDALSILRHAARPGDDFSRQSMYARLAESISRGTALLPELRVAFLSQATLDHLVATLRFWLLLEGFNLKVYLAPFGAWRQEALNPNSGVYKFHPDVIWWFFNQRDAVFDVVPGSSDNECAVLVKNVADDWLSYVRKTQENIAALQIVNNVEQPVARVYGDYEASVPWSRSSLLARLSACLRQGLPSGALVFDLAYQASRFGLDRWEDPRYWYHSKHPFALDATGPVAFAAGRCLSAARGRSRKCLVVDLDNTLWGGVVGDDGVAGLQIGASDGAQGEAFTAFQTYLKALASRGIALAVCSKNDPQIAREPFTARQEMPLRLEDFSAFYANWNDKVSNLRSIASELNLGLDALVFFDDNPAERMQVRSALPMVAVPEVPPDPADYVAALSAGQWFETIAYSLEDGLRGRAYRENSVRREMAQSSPDLASFLQGLQMQASWGTAEAKHLPRMVQLINKTNQFHFTTTRYSLPELAELARSPAAWVSWFALRDRYGEHGIISAVILRYIADTAVIDTWVMSCRVFSRGMEDFIFRVLWLAAADRGARILQGRYCPSERNALVAELYTRFGGTLIESDGPVRRWRFDLSGCPPLESRWIHNEPTPVKEEK
jgi:FkbH-like protein